MGAKATQIMIVLCISEIEKKWGRWHGFLYATTLLL